MQSPRKKMKHLTVSTYRKDKYYPRVVRAVGKLLARADVVAPSEILIEMSSLSKANRILRIIGFHVHDLNMVSRQTVYHQWGKGKNRILRFSKSADPNIEKAYARHYSWNQSPQKKQIAINNALPKQGGAVDQGYSGPIENR